MKRSGDVTAAAIVLFFGSGVLVLFVLFGVLGVALTSSQLQLPPEARYGQFFGLVFYALSSAWGIATGVGILQLRPWARISMLIMSGVAIFLSVFGALGLAMVPMIMRQTPDVPLAAMRVVIAVGVAMLLVPIAIAIWWLILFTRKRVIAEFAARGAAGPPADPQTAFTAPAPPLASSVASTSPRMQLSYRRPVSITVIAVFLLAGAAAFPMFLFYPASWRVTVFFGMILTGRAVLVVFATYSALGILLGTGLLLLKPWAAWEQLSTPSRSP
ncbi:MAG: hypothetical protein WA185_02515 [Candidatus Acidiferrales bacterium]